MNSKKLRRYLTVAMCLLAVVFGVGGFRLYRMVQRTAVEVESFRFATAVADGYMPYFRRKTKVWPKDLNEFEEYMSPGGGWTGAASDTAIDVYERSFQGLDVLNSSAESCSFRLELDRGTMTCESAVNPDGGHCKFTAK